MTLASWSTLSIMKSVSTVMFLCVSSLPSRLLAIGLVNAPSRGVTKTISVASRTPLPLR